MSKELRLFNINKLTQPGGCEIGPRPIDLHLKALRSMGAKINDTQGGFIYSEAEKLKGCDIHLDYPSVGATENIMLAAVYAEGETCIRNAAKEPEIVDLQKFMQAMGVNVSGAGTSVITITGTDSKALTDVEYTIMTDRIVAGTYMAAAGMTGGKVLLKNIISEHITSITSILRDSGCDLRIQGNEMLISGPPRLKKIDITRTLPYPGFPTDMQAQLSAALSIAEGTSIVVETVFENRYMHVDELLKMGANIKVEGRTAIIQGVKKLIGAKVCARDLRGGAALVLAGLTAEGETIVSNIKHIDRGYEMIEKKLSSIGAKIKRI